MANHQTVRLARGSHSSPERGVCVMELASMLAGERFTDRPRSVSPVIGGFLRAYNDRLDDERRQDLYVYAARVVGTRAPRSVERSRARRCIEWARELGCALPLAPGLRPLWGAGALAAGSLIKLSRSDAFHRRALDLVDELICFSDGSAAAPIDPGELLGIGAAGIGSDR